ncbi:MAG: hypothetical protein V1790_12280 [Planctomycetota bacterium]
MGTGRVFPLFGTAVVLSMVLPAVAWAADDRPSSTERPIGGATTVDSGPESLRGPIPPTAPVILVPIPRGTVFKPVVIGVGESNSGVTAGTTDQLIYSDTLGKFAVALGANHLCADDIATIAAPGCRLRRIEFPVVGRVDPAGIGGPYTVNFALYTNCPGSVQNTIRTSLIIPGTQGQGVFPDDAPRLITFIAAPNVLLLTNMWLGVSFSRANAGVVVGAPAQTGFSCDSFDFPGFACNASLGGWPEQPYANLNLELFGDASCGNVFVGYKNTQPSGPIYNPGPSVILADDITMGADNCRMTAYETTVRGAGTYAFDFRTNCEGGVVAGTERSAIVSAGSGARQIRFTVDPPVPLPRRLWFTARASNPDSGIVIAGKQACVGFTDNVVGLLDGSACSLVTIPVPGLQSAVNLTITCAGQPSVGACCDMFFTDENGESVCRQVPEMNCALPPWFSWLQPRWVQGAVCHPDPFGVYPCGVAACCYADQQGDECSNLTQRQCDQAGDLTRPREWQRGRYCSDGGQRCPLIVCLGRTGDCELPRCNSEGRACTGGANNGQTCTSNTQCPGGSCTWCSASYCHVSPTCCDSCPPIGCESAHCCTTVCNYSADGAYCCAVEWDDVCAFLDAKTCDYFPRGNDVCESARLLVIGPSGLVTAETSSGLATEDATDPGFGCYINNPGAQGLQTVWYKFVATQVSAGFSTCNSNPPADDSLVEVFAVGDPSTPLTLCRSLIPIGCSDDSPGCGDSNANSRVCLQGLVPGNVYYVLVASKFAEAPGTKYRLDIQVPCTCTGGTCDPVINNDCLGATTIADGSTPFNLSYATLTAPIESCIPTMINDVWYNYTATCSGTLTVETCGANAETSPDTNLAIYDACLCPPVAGAPIICSSDAGGEYGAASRVTLDVVGGSCYKIRLADSNGNRPSGQIKIECVPDQCADLSPADSDFDGDVDLIDLAAFQRCYAGPGSYDRDSCCRTFDITRDGDIDFDDWADFLVRLKGP